MSVTVNLYLCGVLPRTDIAIVKMGNHACIWYYCCVYISMVPHCILLCFGAVFTYGTCAKCVNTLMLRRQDVCAIWSAAYILVKCACTYAGCMVHDSKVNYYYSHIIYAGCMVHVIFVLFTEGCSWPPRVSSTVNVNDSQNIPTKQFWVSMLSLWS